MATPTEIVWARDPHTAAKHDLLRKYLSAWLPILFTTHPRVTYADGFAGPGVYNRDEPGSPVIALEVIAKHQDLLAAHPDHTLDVVFIEENRRRHDRLEQELARARDRLGRPPPNVHVHPPVCGDCTDQLPRLLTALGAWGTPMFAVLDSFGGPDVPFDVVRSIAANPSGEVLATFGPTFLTRHGENPQHADAGDRAFGSRQWRGVFHEPSERKWAYLVEAYRASLHRAGFAYVLGFEMVDERGSQLWLMFGTSSPKGVEKMKDAMWAVDPANGIRYRDPRDPNQMTLEIQQNPDTAPLSRMLRDVLATGSRSLDQLREYALLETVYRPQQVRGVVRRLISDGLLARSVGGQLSGATTLDLARPRAGGEEQQTLFET